MCKNNTQKTSNDDLWSKCTGPISSEDLGITKDISSKISSDDYIYFEYNSKNTKKNE